MFFSKQKYFCSLALLLLVSIAATGCGKDKSPEDYQQQKSNEEFSKMQLVAASASPSRGSVQAPSETHPVEITLNAVLNPVQNGDNTGTSARASLQGSVTIYTNGSPSTGVITSANFLKAQDQDSETTGTINGTISVVLSSSGTNSQAATFSLNGTLHEGRFTGVITPTDRAGQTLTFSSAKDAPLPGGQGSHNPGPGQARSYSGSAIDPNCSGNHHNAGCGAQDRNGNAMIPVGMTVNPAPSSSGYAFVNLFADVKLVNVHLELDGQNIPLPAIEFDQRSHSLSFNGSVSDSSSNTQIIFACNPAGAGYSCSYENVDKAATYEFQVSPGNFVNPPPAPLPTPAPGPSPVPHHPGHHH
jgi:hypothetical protein